MIRRHGRALRALLMLADGISAVAVGILVYGLRLETGQVDTYNTVALPAWLAMGIYASAWIGVLWLEGQYRLRAHWSLRAEAVGIARAAVWLAIGTPVTLFLVDLDVLSRVFVLLLFPIQVLVLITVRAVLRAVFQMARQHGLNLRYILVLGTDERALGFARQVEEHAALGLRVVGFLGDRPPATPTPWPYLGDPEGLPRVLRQRVVDEVAICDADGDWEAAERYARLSQEEGKIVRLPLEVPSLAPARRFVEDLDGTTVLSYVTGPDQALGLALKRLVDVVIAAGGLVLLSPALLAIGVYIRLRDGGPVLFSQMRVGVHGRSFRMWKFRTMVPDAEERLPEVAHLNSVSGAAFKVVDDPRISRSGRWLRRTSLDELPQLWNVLKGEMSLVGPRPAPQREVEGYDLWQRRRLSMKPGMTGLWQVTSRAGNDFSQRAELDLQYIDHWSFWLDLRILLRTIPALVHLPGR